MFRKIGKFVLAGFVGFVFLTLVGAASLSVQHTAFPTADNSTEFGIPAALENMNTVIQTNMLSKLVVPNNAAASYQIPNSTAYVLFTGTNVANLTVSMPSATNSLDNQEVTIFGAAATSSVSVTSTGATVVGTPSTVTSPNWRVKYKYDTGTLSWYAVGN